MDSSPRWPGLDGVGQPSTARLRAILRGELEGCLYGEAIMPHHEERMIGRSVRPFQGTHVIGYRSRRDMSRANCTDCGVLVCIHLPHWLASTSRLITAGDGEP
jgi:hypothetical protein